jgi:uncharacterized damage-inducible protein DinB
MQQLLILQYDSVKGARQALFAYCQTMSNDALFKPIEAFNNNSIASMLIHTANSYIHWMVFFDQQTPEIYFQDEDVKGMSDIENI